VIQIRRPEPGGILPCPRPADRARHQPPGKGTIITRPFPGTKAEAQ
jgi:hypothetical protein